MQILEAKGYAGWLLIKKSRTIHQSYFLESSEADTTAITHSARFLLILRSHLHNRVHTVYIVHPIVYRLQSYYTINIIK